MINFIAMEENNFEEQKYSRAKKKVKQMKGFYGHLTAYVIVNVFLIIMNATSNGGWKIFWEWQTFSTAIFWGIGLAFHAFNVFGFDFLFGKSWEERKIKDIMDRDKKNYWE